MKFELTIFFVNDMRKYSADIANFANVIRAALRWLGNWENSRSFQKFEGIWAKYILVIYHEPR